MMVRVAASRRPLSGFNQEVRWKPRPLLHLPRRTEGLRHQNGKPASRKLPGDDPGRGLQAVQACGPRHGRLFQLFLPVQRSARSLHVEHRHRLQGGELRARPERRRLSPRYASSSWIQEADVGPGEQLP
uniref:Uncharacterized protein n=1 Tax=Clastoptera arizonana TaxID=38151 RepID=A0A1B6C892_9HEMI